MIRNINYGEKRLGMELNKLSKKSDAYVRVEDCRERHDVTAGRVTKIDNALFGEDFRGGMAKDIADIKSDIRVIKNNGKLSGKDKAVIFAALITAIASLIAVLLKG